MSMHQLTQQYWSRAQKIAQQYQQQEINFADLTGLADTFAATFANDTQSLARPEQTTIYQTLESTLTQAIQELDDDSAVAQALNELLIALTRTPIY